VAGMDLPLALITGASRGIGAAVAHQLSPTHRLLLGGRDRDALAKVASELPGAEPWPVDLTDVGSLEAAVRGIDRLDVLVHSAGAAQLGTVAEAPSAAWRTNLEVNVIAVAELTRLLLPALRAARGQVVVINSGGGYRARAGWGPYAASKFAARAFADSLREEEPELRVTSVFPGRTDTDMQRSVRAQEGGEYEAGAYLRPDSVATAVVTAVMASPEAHFTEVQVRPRG